MPSAREIVDELLARKLQVRLSDRSGNNLYGVPIKDALEHLVFTTSGGKAGFRHPGAVHRLVVQAAQDSAVARRVAEQHARHGGQLSEEALVAIREQVAAELAEQLAEVEDDAR